MRIERRVARKMVQYALDQSPKECCGLLSGKTDWIHQIHPCSNQLYSENAFSIPSEELFDFFRKIRSEKSDFLGIYHSHPRTRAKPSGRDRREFYYFDVSYWIISLSGSSPELKCFVWNRGDFVEKEYEIVINRQI